MANNSEYNFSLGLPYSVIAKMNPVKLPPNMHKQYEYFLNNLEDTSISERLNMREEGAANIVIMSQIIQMMVVQDKSFDEAYESLRGEVGDMMKELDEVFGELMEEEESKKLFRQLFQSVVKMSKINDGNARKEEHGDKVFVNLRDVNGEIINSLEEYGVDYLAAEILADENISNDIENKYLKPIQGLLKEYVSLFLEEMEADEEEYYEMFSTIFLQSKAFVAYQALLELIINEAIEKGLRVSDAIKGIDRDKLVRDSKNVILRYEGLDDYKEEIESVMKLLIGEKTQ